MWNKLKKRKYLIGLQVLIITAMVAAMTFVGGVTLQDKPPSEDILSISMGEKVIVVGNPVYAAGTPDYNCDGVDDDVQFQLAIDALPANGGKLVILSGNYSLSNPVTRAIANITVEGMGRATYIARDGVNFTFVAGGNNWVFTNLRTDAGSIDMGVTTGWQWTNVTVNITYYAARTSANVGNSWNIPVGRGMTLVVAASNSSAQGIAQADYICDGVTDNVEIQAAMTAVGALGGGTVVLLEGTYTLGAAVSMQSNVSLTGCGRGTVIQNTALCGFNVIQAGAKSNFTISDLALNAVDESGIGISNNCANFTINNCFFISTDEEAVEVIESEWGIISSCYFTASSMGVEVQTGSHHITVVGNIFDNCTDTAIWVGTYDAAKPNFHCSVTANIIEGGSYGVYLWQTQYTTVTGNTIKNPTTGIRARSLAPLECSYNTISDNTLEGAYILVGAPHNTVDSNIVIGATNTGIQVTSDYCVVSNNTCMNAGTSGIAIWDGDYNLVTGNQCGDDQGAPTQDYGIQIFRDVGLPSYNRIIGNNCFNNTLFDIRETANCDHNVIIYNTVGANSIQFAGAATQVYSNQNIRPTDERICVYMSNSTGGNRLAGEVVITRGTWGFEFVTTAILGDDKVVGILAEDIANAAYGYVQVEGKTTILKFSADQGAIAPGDFLTCNNVVTEAALAVPGDMVFAISLEASAIDTALDAILIKPRKL